MFIGSEQGLVIPDLIFDMPEMKQDIKQYIQQDTTEAEGSDGESDSEFKLGFMKHPLYSAPDLSFVSDLSYTDNIPEPDNAPYPPQFDPAIHHQAVLLYGTEDLHGAEWQERRYSKRELKELCRGFGLKGWQRKSFEKQDFFVWWVVSELGAVLARKMGDEVLPVEEMGCYKGMVVEAEKESFVELGKLKKKRERKVKA